MSKNVINVINNLANFEANIFKDSFQKYKRSNTITLGDKGIRFRFDSATACCAARVRILLCGVIVMACCVTARFGVIAVVFVRLRACAVVLARRRFCDDVS